MKVISAIYDTKKNAGPKAPEDINKILKNKYNAEIISILRKNNFRLKLILIFIKMFFCQEWIILQHPLLLRSYVYNFLPRKKTVILIHDICGLRNKDDKLLKQEVNIFKKFKYIIVHNNVMKNLLIEKGINENNIYVLELFDYLANGDVKEEFKFNIDKMRIIYPGNLIKEKSPFLHQLDENKMNFIINMYGIGINDNLSSNLIYKGSFEPEEINDLEGDLGLIWDGNFDESDENLGFKNYTKYNNPHKLSCCMAMGLPVIVWEKAAIAEFVKKENVGYTINSLYDINNIDFSNYDEKRKNAIKISKKVRNGNYTKGVLSFINNER